MILFQIVHAFLTCTKGAKTVLSLLEMPLKCVTLVIILWGRFFRAIWRMSCNKKLPLSHFIRQDLSWPWSGGSWRMEERFDMRNTWLLPPFLRLLMKSLWFFSIRTNGKTKRKRGFFVKCIFNTKNISNKQNSFLVDS